MHPIMDSLRTWLYAHDTALDLATIWALVVGFAGWAIVKLSSWWVLRATQDQTAVGRALKPQKLTEGIILVALTVAYALGLDAYYQQTRLNFWLRLGVRVFLIAAIIPAVIFGVRFIRALMAVVNDRSTDPADEPRPLGLP